MFRNECSRNCWLAAAVFGLLVWLFNATLIGGFVLGLMTFFLLGKTLIWLVCEGRGGAAEDAEVLGDRPAPPPAGDALLERAEQAVVDASVAFAASTVATVTKGREALQARLDPPPPAPEPVDDSVLERAGDRLEQAGEGMQDAMEALAARGKKQDGDVAIMAEDIQAGNEPDPALAARVSPSGQFAVASDPQDAVLHQPAAEPEPAPEPVPEPVPAPAVETAPKAAKPKKAKSEKASSAKSGKTKADKSAKPAKAGGTEVKAAKEKPGKSRAEKFADAVADAATPTKGKAKKAKASAEKPVKVEKQKAKKVKAKPDDLKEIKGVGPQLEALLNQHGVTRFAQIAGWNDTEIDHYAGLIGRMGGRIRSDDWVAQANLLAAGGDTEFSRRVDKGEVY